MNYFVSRHVGAIAWAKQQLNIDHYVTHLDVTNITTGDCVYGTLPVHLAAQCCAQRCSLFSPQLKRS